MHWGILGLHRGCFWGLGVAPEGELGCTGPVRGSCIGEVHGGCIGGLRVPWGCRWRCMGGHWRLGVHWRGGGGALEVHWGAVRVTSGGLLGGCIWGALGVHQACAAAVSVPAAAAPAPVCPVLSHACERARPCAPVRSHPSPRGPWRSLRRPRVPLPVRSHGRRGVPAAPRKPREASFGSVTGAGICLHHPAFRLASIPAPSPSPRAAAGRWWPGALRGPRHVLALRSGSRSPLPAEPVPAALGQELPNPSARSRRFPNQFGAAPALLAFSLSRVLSTRPFTSFWCFCSRNCNSVSKERGGEATKAKSRANPATRHLFLEDPVPPDPP